VDRGGAGAGAAGAGGVSASLKSNSIGAPPIARAGSPEFKARVLPQILSGKKISAARDHRAERRLRRCQLAHDRTPRRRLLCGER